MGLKRIKHYEIKAEIGRGGMSTVYQAYDPRFERDIAIKVLPAALMHADESFRLRFEQEVKLIAALEHSAVVSVYDYGDVDGQPYFVMRLMSGGSLADRMKAGPFSVPEAAQILTRLAPALDAAHAQGIVHRDVKPGNILFDRHNDVYLSDFGIAKLIQSAATLTGSNAIIGTPAYMSPEQGRGETDIDGRSDLYSLGAVLFEMLTGRVPYEADTPTGQIIKHIIEPVPNILEVNADLPPRCQQVIECAMAKDKADRFATTAELAYALESVHQGKTLPGAPPVGRTSGSRAYPARLARSRMRKPLWIGGAAIFVILAAFIFWSWYASGFPPIFSEVLTATPTDTLMPIKTPTPRPTATAHPSTSSPTAQPTSNASVTGAFASTPQPYAVVTVNALNARSGPGAVYPVLTTYLKGTELEVVGKNMDETWLVVQLPDSGLRGWVIAKAVDFAGNLQALAEVEAGPTPTPRLEYSPTPTSTRDKESSEPTDVPKPPAPTKTEPPAPTETEAPTPYP